MREGSLRPFVHAALLGFAFLEPVLGRWGMAGIALAALGVNAWVLPGTPFGRALAREGEGRWNGLLSYPLAVALLYALLSPEAAAVGWSALALGDPAAAWAGRGAKGWPRLPWNRRKSLAGTLTFVSVAWIGSAFVAAASLPAVLGLPRAQLLSDPQALAAFACMTATAASAGAVVESLDLGIDDNLPVALAAGGAFALLAGPNPL